jgi:hypothetical protein
MKRVLIPIVVLAAAPALLAQHHHAGHGVASPSARALAQIEQVRAATASITTPEAARAADYAPALGWIPMMGTHWVHGRRMMQGRTAVTLTTPSQLMFSRKDGKETLVGIAFAFYADVNDRSTPELFDGAPAWHDHPDLSPPGTTMHMLHVWFVESPDGPFAGMNPFLPYWAAGVMPPDAARMNDPATAARVRKAAIALAEIVDPAGLFPILARRPAMRAVLDERRPAMRALADRLDAVRQPARASDHAAWDAVADELGQHLDAIRDAYVATAIDPVVKERIAKAIAEMIVGGH